MLQDKQKIIEDSKTLQKSIVRMLINVMDLRDTELMPESLRVDFDDFKDFEQGYREAPSPVGWSVDRHQNLGGLIIVKVQTSLLGPKQQGKQTQGQGAFLSLIIQ